MGLATLLSIVLAGGSCQYVILFAQQNTFCEAEKDFHYSHSFATFVETDEDHNITESVTISWSGEKGVVLFSGPQQGINRDLAASLERARCRGLCVMMFGPYQASCQAYQAAKCQHAKLERGECAGCPRYNVLDSVSRHLPCHAFNCIHALTDIVGSKVHTGSVNGIDATRAIIKVYKEHCFITGNDPADAWVWEAIRPVGYEVRCARE